MAYPDYPSVDAVRLPPTDFVTLHDLEGFRIERVEFDGAGSGLHLRMSGTARSIKAGSPDFPRDLGLTVYQIAMDRHRLPALVGVMVWVFAATAGMYRLLKMVRA